MDPLLRGEQAVLGAVLLDPAQLDTLRWLAPADFYRPAHRALFAAMRKLQSAGLAALGVRGEVPLSWVTDTVAEAGRHVRGLTASYAHTLIAACPRPEHAPVYGRMVLEGSIHRTVTEHAVRLEHAARMEAEQQQVEGVLHHVDVLADVLGDLSRRWGTELRPAPRPGPVPAPTLVRSERTEDERFLLAVLIDQPAAMEEVYGWLRPQDFADAGHGQLYRCLGALHHRGEPIDQVTALWEVQRRGLLADGTLTQDQLDTLFGGPGVGSAEWLGDQIIRSAVVRTAAQAAASIKTLAEDETLAPGRLISQALHALGPLDEVRIRWRAATLPTPAWPQGDPAARVGAALSRSTPRSGPPAATPSRADLPAGAALIGPTVRASPRHPVRSPP
ncbi:helicase DnaB [Kitasatospora sp. NBC_01287]|uniref:DnaB-like helicase N-terminal domain-containing protein n=1 Tax=Kitasatospora sp. NBC_01287 TaxID=2903573 RepID=UPI0022570211|nr:DnaB-like helicase N-terminal domain-containing protein [Kitasatospora sp. NBC_01287]MCX4751259.1 helicase DnaB [Kitasatospora sp. NBC_01287]